MDNPNPVLKKLGLNNDDRLVIFHADDIGGFQSSLAAYRDILDFGLISAASTMVPCPWFPAVAAFCREHPDHPNLDMGVHLTLTSEWRSYRWGPITAQDASSGLFDEEGYFHDTSEAVRERAGVEAVRAELRAQVERALAAGIDITHLDSHMFTLMHPRFFDLYIALALELRVPPFLLRRSVPEFNRYSVSQEAQTALQERIALLEEQGVPLLDDATMMPLDQPENRGAQLLQKVEGLKPGITYLICHPNIDTPETREAIPDHDWPNRVADYETFMDSGVRDAVRKSGVHVIGYRVLRDLMRESLGA